MNEKEMQNDVDMLDQSGLPDVVDSELKFGPADMTGVTDDEGVNDLPIDRGWAWVVLAAAVYEVFIWGGLMKSFGIFFVVYQERFQSTASQTSVIAMIQNIVLSISGVFVMTVGMKYLSARTIIVIGALVNFAAYVASAFADDIRILYVSIGAVSGLCIAMVYLPIMAMIGIYFDRRRALANAIFSAGASLGGLVCGPFYTWLFDEYGYTSTILITSGLLFNILVSGMLMRPIEQFAPTPTKHKRPGTQVEKNRLIGERVDFRNSNTSSVFADPATSSKELCDSGREYIDSTVDKDQHISDSYIQDTRVVPERVHLFRALSGPVPESEPQTSPGHKNRHVSSTFNRTVSYDPTDMQHRQFPSLQRIKTDTAGSLRHRTISLKSQDDAVRGLLPSVDYMCGSLVNVNIQTCVERAEARSHGSGDKAQSNTCFGAFSNRAVVILKVIFDISLLRDPVFVVYLIMAAAYLPCCVLTPVYIVTLAKDIGVTNSQIGIMLFVIGCVDLVARVTVGVVADRRLARPTTIVATGAVVLGTTAHILRWLHTFPTLLIFVVVAGLCCGMYIALYAVILMDLLGMERFHSRLGFTNMCHGAALAALYPITGLLRDTTGSYYTTFHLLGGLLFLAAALALSLPRLAKWRSLKHVPDA